MANGGKQNHIADDGKKVLTDEEIYPPLENITLEQAYEDYAKAAEEMKDTLLNEITKLREQLEYLQGEREVLLEDIQVRSNQVIEQQAEIEEYRCNIKQLTETLTGGNGLRIRVDNMIVYADDLEEWLEFCDKQKAETIKELEAKIHEKLHEAEMHGNFEPVVTREMFDSVVKELVGEGK
jgi:TolA-binding protein